MTTYTPIAEVNLNTVKTARALLERVPLNGIGEARASLVCVDLLEGILRGDVVMCYPTNDGSGNQPNETENT